MNHNMLKNHLPTVVLYTHTQTERRSQRERERGEMLVQLQHMSLELHPAVDC